MGFGVWVWGLGMGDWAQSPIPNPQSPIPNPHDLINIKIINIFYKKKVNYAIININFYININVWNRFRKL